MRECKDCGEEIDPRRVQAKPNVEVCLSCQEEREAKGKFKRSTIEIGQEIEGWSFEGQKEHLIPGDS